MRRIIENVLPPRRSDTRTRSVFLLFPMWGWDSEDRKVWRWLENVEYMQTYCDVPYPCEYTFEQQYKLAWGEKYWTDLKG